eukprot:g40087.t1
MACNLYRFKEFVGPLNRTHCVWNTHISISRRASFSLQATPTWLEGFNSLIATCVPVPCVPPEPSIPLVARMATVSSLQMKEEKMSSFITQSVPSRLPLVSRSNSADTLPNDTPPASLREGWGVQVERKHQVDPDPPDDSSDDEPPVDVSLGSLANRSYLWLMIDPWHEHHAPDEIVLGLYSDRKDVEKAPTVQIVRKLAEFLSEHKGKAGAMRLRHVQAAQNDAADRVAKYDALVYELGREPTAEEKESAGAYPDAFYPQDGETDVKQGTGEVLRERGNGLRDCVTQSYLNLIPRAATKKASYRRRLAKSAHTASVTAFCKESASAEWHTDANGKVWRPRLLKGVGFNDILKGRVKGDLLVASDGHCVALRGRKIMNAGSYREMPLTRSNLISVGIKDGHALEVARL